MSNASGKVMAALVLSATVVSLLLIGAAFRVMHASAATRSRLRSEAHPSLSQQLRKLFEVIGHRGNSDVAPENTLAAVKAALTSGNDGYEIDVRLSRDGIPLAIHDDTLEPRRTARVQWRP